MALSARSYKKHIKKYIKEAYKNGGGTTKGAKEYLNSLNIPGFFSAPEKVHAYFDLSRMLLKIPDNTSQEDAIDVLEIYIAVQIKIMSHRMR